MQNKTLQYQSSSIFYRVTGNGKPVILLHGFGEDGNIWNAQINFLEDHFQLIIPDLPGSGRSTVLSSQLAVGIEEYAKIVHAILEEEKLTRCSVIGHSMGGYIALAFAEKFPSLLSSFGLVHSSAFADNEEKKTTRRKAIEFIKNNGAHEFLKASIPGLFSDEWSRQNQEKIDSLVEKGNSISAEVLIQYYEAMIRRPDRTMVLKNFAGPILFIMGQHDKAVPFEQSLQQCYLPTWSQVHILRQSAHMGMWEEPALTNNYLLQFLQ